MLSGINKQLKQIIGHYYGSADKVLFKDVILHLLKTLIANRRYIVAVNCNQGSSNRGDYDLMGVITEHPWIHIDDAPIFCFAFV